jgi:hypothetical protein
METPRNKVLYGPVVAIYLRFSTSKQETSNQHLELTRSSKCRGLLMEKLIDAFESGPWEKFVSRAQMAKGKA